MNKQEEARKLVPGVKDFAKKLLSICEEMHPSNYEENDNMGLMALVFLSKQMEHLLSIIILVDEGQGRDAEIIVRSMYEGLVQLKWAIQDAKERALRWRSYIWIAVWRRIKEQRKNGKKVKSELYKEILEAIKEYGEQFYTRKARNRLQKGKPLPDDPYQKSWIGKPLKQIAKKVKGEQLYKDLYKPISEWSHWDPIGLGRAVKIKGDDTEFYAPSYASFYNSLALGFQCLHETAEIVNNHFERGLDKKIQGIKDKYIQWQEKNKASKSK